MAISLSELRTAVRQRCNMEGSTFVTDAELSGYINYAYSELYDHLVSTSEDYYSNTLSITIASGEDGYTMPFSIHKIRGIDRALNGTYQNIREFSFQDRNLSSPYLGGIDPVLDNSVKYRWMGRRLKFIPENNAAGTYRVWYIPAYVPLEDDDDELNEEAVQGWDEYIINRAAMQCLEKEESDISALMARHQQLIQRIKSAADNRNYDSPAKVQDVRYHEWDQRYWWV